MASLRWIFAVSERFSRVDRNGRSAAASLLSTMGICFGVMTLVVVVSVMNGFQMSFVDAIMEISSYHLRVSDIPAAEREDFLEWCRTDRLVLCAQPFYEAQGLIVGESRKEAAGIVRGVEPDVLSEDAGFARELKIVSGAFDIADGAGIVLGSRLAGLLGVRVGGTVNLFALSGGRDVALVSGNRQFVVSGIFECGYADINQSYAFISADAARRHFGGGSEPVYGVKLRRAGDDVVAIPLLERRFPQADVRSWREYNRSFFSALRIEKNILMFLVFLIFIVVGINIYNGMRRLVFERSGEISILSALGGTKEEVKLIFIMRGFMNGCKGVLAGVALGLLASVNMKSVFLFASRAMYAVECFSAMLLAPEKAVWIRENPMYQVYASIPARIVPSEVLLIALFGMAAPLAASWRASHTVLNMNVAEVLHDA
ncbi:MAG: ABC transporter permease [Treponemataceae bacterium]|nr:ABC transporter permease [Treponemataceae bacterium]